MEIPGADIIASTSVIDCRQGCVSVFVFVALIFALVGFAQMTQWALDKRKNYCAEFKDYPRGRKSIIPFILWSLAAAPSAAHSDLMSASTNQWCCFDAVTGDTWLRCRRDLQWS